MSFEHVKKLLQDQLYAVLLIRGQGADGGARYCFLSVRLDRLDLLVQAQQQGVPFEPTEFGRVLASGAGEPDEIVMQHMADEYGFDPVSQMALSDV